MADIITLDTDYYGDIEPDKVLEGAKGALERVVVLGIDNEGEIYLADSQGSVASTNLLLDRAKRKILDDISA